MDDYSKYYNLEKYLIDEVGRNFRENGSVTPRDFYCILIWKSNRAKTKNASRLIKIFGSFDKAVEEITENIWIESDPRKKLHYLLKKAKFKIATASAILTILYPDKFTVYDYRVCEILNDHKELANKVSCDKITYGYMKFRDTVLNSAEFKSNLRDKDRYLWGESFFRNINTDFKKFEPERLI
jgi:hypothetical protein